MALEFLMAGIGEPPEGSMPIDVSGVTSDSRRVGPGWVFVAVPGFERDGREFVPDAVRQGAVAVVAEQPVASCPVPVFHVPSTRRALGRLAARFYGSPSHGLRLIGVTGTNGKTTVTYLLESIFRAAGERVGVIGTLGVRFNGRQMATGHTTPEADAIQSYLAQMVAYGVTTVAMEVSSHGLTLERVGGCAFDAAVFTNLTQDHLDFHKDMESYYQAKRQLFTEVLREGGKRTVVVLNADDAHGRRLAEDSVVDSERWLYTLGDAPVRAGITVTSLEQSLDGTRIELKTPAGPMTVNSPLIGRFNVSNLLAAVSTGLASGVAVPAIERGLSGMTGVPGRLERVSNSRGVHAFVDYAHTPDAIDRVAGTLAELRIGRLITLFGCGGDRDRSKRPLMAEAAARHSSQVILTSDNPRTENPETILDEAEAGLRKAGWQKAGGEVLADHEYLRVGDRAQAIALAVRMSLPGDTILVAGKGHEDYQIIGQEKRHFDDREELAKAFKDSGR